MLRRGDRGSRCLADGSTTRRCRRCSCCAPWPHHPWRCSTRLFAFADHVAGGLGIGSPGPNPTQTAVALFFVILGYIMVVSSGALFGRAGGSLVFWARRGVRILPPYWLATALLVAVILLLIGRPVDTAQLAMSLALLPYWSGGDGAPLPLLWPGWTLFYELVFYALFGIGISAGRMRAVLGAALGIGALVLAGALWSLHSALLFSLTRPVSLLFVGGMALGLMREHGRALAPAWRWAAAAGAMAAYVLMPEPAAPRDLSLAYTLWTGVPALLACLALLSGPLRLACFALIDRLGDISYALYLLHLPLAWIWVHFWPGALRGLGAWGFLLSLAAATYGASLLAFLYVERPLTRWLNGRLTRRLGDDALLQRTGV